MVRICGTRSVVRSLENDGQPVMDEHSTDRPHVLIAEDCPDVSQMMKVFLEGAGYRVDVAESVAEGVDVAKRTPVGLVVSDFRLQDGTAWELIRRLREMQPVRGIVVSGYSDQVYKDKSKEAGFSEYLVKPVEQDELVAAVDRVLDSLPS